MSDSPCAPFVFALSVISGLVVADGAAAQTCANPDFASVGMTMTGNTCDTTNAMPTQNHGTILTPGGERVFRFGGTYGVDGVLLQADAHKVFVFVCSGCGPNAECVASGESNGASALVAYPNDGQPYYVIVDSPQETCTDYQITPTGPLKQGP